MANKWVFTQIEGRGSDRKTLELEGYNAPFGRPRKDPVITETIRSRIQTTRYPGSNIQTRSAFGTNWEPTELKGRWMTKSAGPNKSAADMADDWSKFVRDERTCQIAWGFIVSFKGYIEELTLARESEHEIAWKMKVQIDTRDDLVTRRVPRPYQPAADNLAEIQKFLEKSSLLQKPAVPDMSPDFFDQLDALAGELNKPSAFMNEIAGRFNDIEKASFSAIQHFRGALTGMRTAVVNMRETIIGAGVDDALLVRTAESDLAWARYQADFDNQTLYVLDQLNLLDRKAELAQRNEATKFITAKNGDTWESLSIRATGSADKAGEIRQFAGALYGQLPTPNESYLVP